VPYRCLFNCKFDNLLAAGRIASASGDGWEVLRVIPVAALTGQAAGTAAALSVNSGCRVGEVDMNVLQSRLERSGIMIHNR
jgi:hypothetical protein